MKQIPDLVEPKRFWITVSPGLQPIPSRDNSIHRTFVRVVYDNERLALFGVQGPIWTGNAYGKSGQIAARLREPWADFDPEWTPHMVHYLAAVWRHHHLDYRPPQPVLDFLRALPITHHIPAWI